MIRIDPFNQERYDEIRSRWDKVAKPLNSLGKFEDITARIGAVHDSARIDIRKRAVIMMCADNGVVAEGVSQSGQDITAAVAGWMGKGISSVCKMAKTCKADTIPVDVGINMEGSPKGVIDRKVMKGTRNFAHEPAMTEDECMQAIDAGIDMVCDCSAKGYKLLATGEMGIGNTTTSSALAAALLGLDAATVTGRGAGLSTSGLGRKIQVIQEALDRYIPEDDVDIKSPEYATQMLACVGGLDIAGLTGVFIGGAIYHIPVIIDGFISSVAALVAERLAPGSRNYMIASHTGKEPGMKYILDELGLDAVIDGGLALGEGTGAVMLMPLLDAALTLYTDGLEFEETTVGQYTHFDETKVTLIIGYPDSGKSALAEELITGNSTADMNGIKSGRYYVATMIPYGDEGEERIRKHRYMREGKGFITIEQPYDVDKIIERIYDPAESDVLLECVSNLAANELFERHTDADQTVRKITGDIRKLTRQLRSIVIVTNHYEIEAGFDEETMLYAKTLDRINEKLRSLADEVIEL